MAKQPQILWAQRESYLLLTIGVDEAKIETLKGEGNKFHFQGSSNTEKFETTLELFDEIDPESIQRVGSSTRVVELSIKKKTAAWWPRLLQVKGKVHWLKVDFSKWIDEDAEEETDDPTMGAGLGNGFDLNQYMSSLGNSGAANEFAGLEDDDEDDDDYKNMNLDDESDVYNPGCLSDMPDLEENEGDENKTEVKA